MDEHLAELERLADTAGAVVVGQLTQQLDRPDPATYIGSGKLEELRVQSEEKNATVVIFDDELSPVQGKKLEEAVGKRVIDRAELILDIFALRARSAEAKLQVELAQLEYSLPRLKNLWTHLEKFRGGIGVRGPGETQLETDRRLVGQRIKVLKERLGEVKKSREVQRAGRRGAFRVTLVGYTNAGKSSILRGLADAADVFVEDRLFATLDPLTREVSLDDPLTSHGSRLTAVVTDTVGFIRKLPHHLVASFRATLEEVREANLLIHVLDASHPGWEEQRLVVDEVLAELGVHEKPVVHAFNKIDRLGPDALAALRVRMTNLLPHSVFVSAVAPLAVLSGPKDAVLSGPKDAVLSRAKDGLEPLRGALRIAAEKERPVVELRLSSADGKRLAEIHRAGEVLETRHDDATGELVVRARLDAAAVARLNGRAG